MFEFFFLSLQNYVLYVSPPQINLGIFFYKKKSLVNFPQGFKHQYNFPV